jgi:hypothetical protein
MKPKTRSPQWQILCELLGLAVIGLVLWLAAIGWLPVPSASAAPGAPLTATRKNDWPSICSASGTTAAGQWEPSFSRKRRQTR